MGLGAISAATTGIDLAEARKLGVKTEGDVAVLRRLRVRDPEDAGPGQLAAPSLTR